MPENGSNAERYRFGDFELNSGERTLSQNGKRVSLTPRAFDLLLALVRADGHLLSKEALLDTVWADAVVEEGNLNRTISSIRKALGEQRGESRFIETVPKSGYRFVARIEANMPANGSQPERVVAVSSLSERRNIRWLLPVGAFVILFGALVTVYFVVPRAASPVVGPKPTMTRLTNNEFDEDQAEWADDGQIRFVRFVTGTRGESWIMNADGTDQRRANDRIKNLQTGGWSPDGKQVVFVKDGEGPRSVYLANTDGSNERKLPLSYPPSGWSPDGTKLIYASQVDGPNSDVFVYDIASNRSLNLTNSAAFDADPVFSPDGAKVAFVSDRDGNKDAYAMNIDGTGLVRLTDHPAVDAFPVFSPDGTQVVFDSNRQGENIDIYIKNVNDLSPPVKVTSLASNEEHRARCWSPDGTKLVITSDQSGKSNIYVMDVEPFRAVPVLGDPDADLQSPAISPDGKQFAVQMRSSDKSLALQLYDTRSSKLVRTVWRTESDAPSLVMAPAFSPSGDRIVFTGRANDNSEILSVRPDGTDVVNLSNNAASDAAPAFSADGRTVYFQSNRDGSFQGFSLFQMNLDGSGQRRVTSTNGYEFSPRPLPGRDALVFSGDRQDSTSRALDIRLLDLADMSETIIAQRRFHDSQPAVSPDGKQVAFVAQSDGNSEIYLVNIDGSGLVRLTRNTADDINPAFSADGRSLYFSSKRTGRYAIFRLDLDGQVAPGQ